MPQLNDVQYQFLRDLGFTGTINDMTLAYLKSLGATANTIPDAYYQLFQGQWNDNFFAFLLSEGAEGGQLNDLMLSYFGGGVTPPIPPIRPLSLLKYSFNQEDLALAITDRVTGTDQLTTSIGTDVNAQQSSDNSIVTFSPLEQAFDVGTGALIEPIGVNLLPDPFSDDFTAWEQVRVTVSSNVELSPFGTLTADAIYPTTDDATHYLIYRNLPINANASTSIFAKAFGYDFIILRLGNTPANNTGVKVDLRTGDIQNIILGAININVIPIADSWYRIEFSVIYSNPSTPNILINPAIALTDSFIGDPSKGILICGAQPEEALFSSSYISSSIGTRDPSSPIIPTSEPTSYVVYAEFIETLKGPQFALIWGSIGSAVVAVYTGFVDGQYVLGYDGDESGLEPIITLEFANGIQAGDQIIHSTYITETLFTARMFNKRTGELVQDSTVDNIGLAALSNALYLGDAGSAEVSSKTLIDFEVTEYTVPPTPSNIPINALTDDDNNFIMVNGQYLTAE